MSWLTDPWSTELVTRAGLELILIGALGGALGVFVVVRGLAFTVEAFSHTVFPGAVLAAALGGSIFLGGLAAALAAALGMAVAARQRRGQDEVAVGVVFTGMFAAGVLLFAVLGPFDRDITSFLFGDPLAVTREDLAVSAVAAAAIGVALFATRRPLVASSFDRESAAASGVRVGGIELLLLFLLALAVVISIRAIGNVLVLAMFVTPAAGARLACRRLSTTVLVAIGLGVASGLGGLYLSYYADLAMGGSVVLVATALFALTWLASPHRGMRAAMRRALAARPARA